MKKLQAPEEYWRLDDEEKKKLLNQCGPDGPLNSVVPNHLLGLNISDQCDVHDFMFSKAQNSEDFKEADKVFLKNMMTHIENNPSSLSIWRKMLAYIYFGAVRIYSWFQK
ncbi:MAG: hypothetical protein H6626_02940 [Pseudobdellovibrionaceae bacterium]|nr:MAG: hypothetical protein H6626_02940 [Pseudobdellovibrionaceae bacterium]